MGITGLIPFLEKASKKFNIKELKGTTVAVDTYCWLHKGAFAVADKIARGEETNVHIQYCLKYVNMLLGFGIKPILVFDGQHLPAKALTESKRRENKKQAKKLAMESLRKGDSEQARTYLRRCVDITHEMALELIKECRNINVDCIVAPYEADAQLAYLNKLKIADYVITEDSDLVLFGCSNIIFKLDLAGSCVLVEADKLHLAMGCREEKFTFDKFRYMCILSGCDYLDSLPGIGLAKACKFILKTEDPDIQRALTKIPSYLNMRQLTVTDEYIEEFMKALATFQHMFVYDPIRRKMVRLNELSETGIDEKFCSNAGHELDNDIAFQLALGNLNPFNLKVLDEWTPDSVAVLKQPSGKSKSWTAPKISKHPSIWKSKYEEILKRTQSNEVFVKKSRIIRIKNQSCSDILEIEDDEEEIDLIKQYARERTPPIDKRQSEQITPIKSPSPKKLKRNPFLKLAAIDIYKAENEEDEDENKPISLLRNLTPAATKCNNQISKFPKTVIEENDKKIISPFFKHKVTTNEKYSCSQSSSTSNLENIPASEILSYEVTEIYEESNTQESSNNNILKKFEYKKSSTILQTTTTPVKLDNEISESPTKQRQHTPKKTTITPIKFKTPSKRKTPVKKAATRRIGLSKKFSSSSISSNAQSKLSQFGFQKKTILK